MGNSKDWIGIPASRYPVMQDKIPTTRFWNKQRIYTDRRGYFYHRDPLHNEVEVYDACRKHIGVMTPEGAWHPRKGRDKRKTLKGTI